MQKMMKFLYSLFASLLIMNSLTAIDLRILELLPNLACPLAVDPAIPEDFIALSEDGTLNPYDWIYWGPKSVLKAYFKNPNSLKEPILRVKLSANVAQTGSNEFDNGKAIKSIEEATSHPVDSMETQWGNYPVLSVKTKMLGHFVTSAWVGLNDPDGWTLLFNLVYPEKEGKNKDDEQLWDNFIMNTTELKDGDYFKAHGQDLQNGYTIVNAGDKKLKIIAEKKQSDGTMQVVVIPESSDVSFNYIDMTEGAMGAKWKYGEPLVKVYGEIVINSKKAKSIINSVTSIFYKTVTDFTFKKDNKNKSVIFQKNFNKID